MSRPEAPPLSAFERIQQRLGELYVHTPSHAHALAQMQHCLNRYLRLGQPSGFLLAGDSGTGKTRSLAELESWLRKTYPAYAGRRCLFIKTNVPAECTPRTLAAALLEGAGDPFAWRNATRHDREARVRKMFSEIDPVGVILDEAQNAFDGKTKDGVRVVHRALKNHYNDYQRPLILAGIPKLLASVAASEELDQRFQNFAILPTYHLADRALMAEFRGVLAKLESVIPLATGISFRDDLLALRMWLASGGVLRRLIQLCKEACHVADLAGATALDPTHFSEGFRHLLHQRNRVADPFVLADQKVMDAASAELARQPRNAAGAQGT